MNNKQLSTFHLPISTCSLKRKVLCIGDYYGKNISFLVYKSLICRKSMKAIEKIKKSCYA